jgi:cytosine/adenosine deaminase-related metal-dependent hydrolase
MFVNAHTHLYSALAPLGMPEAADPPAGFLKILRTIWWRLDRMLDEPSLRAAARYYVAKARAAGTDVLVDHHESPNFIEGSLDVLADACEEFGMAAVLCYGATERNGGRAEAQRGLAECRRFIETNRRSFVTGAVGLHASFTVSDDTIREAGALCRELGAILHVHVAEDVADVEDARRRGYAGPLERLMTLGALPSGSILAHGVHLSAAQVAAAERAGCWLVQNPRSNRHNGVGYAGALGASQKVALGTDGFDSDMQTEETSLERVRGREGESVVVARARLDAGWRLAEERFGPDVLTLKKEASVPTGVVNGSLEEEARQEAGRLFARG